MDGGREERDGALPGLEQKTRKREGVREIA